MSLTTCYLLVLYLLLLTLKKLSRLQLLCQSVMGSIDICESRGIWWGLKRGQHEKISLVYCMYEVAWAICRLNCRCLCELPLLFCLVDGSLVVRSCQEWRVFCSLWCGCSSLSHCFSLLVTSSHCCSICISSHTWNLPSRWSNTFLRCVMVCDRS